jgi:hypothetical protein
MRMLKCTHFTREVITEALQLRSVGIGGICRKNGRGEKLTNKVSRKQKREK